VPLRRVLRTQAVREPIGPVAVVRKKSQG